MDKIVFGMGARVARMVERKMERKMVASQVDSNPEERMVERTEEEKEAKEEKVTSPIEIGFLLMLTARLLLSVLPRRLSSAETSKMVQSRDSEDLLKRLLICSTMMITMVLALQM